jgi:hypothetical protein
MLNEFDIAKALRDHLASIQNMPPIATEGVKFKPTIGQSWLAEFCLGGEQHSPSTSETTSIIRGVYQIDVNTPSGGGKWSTLKYADQVLNHFIELKSNPLNTNSAKIYVTNAGRSPIVVDGDWLKVSISIYYLARGV